MHRRTTSKTFKHAQTLRDNLTEAEHRLWQYLRAHRLNGIHFRRQHAIGPYIVDFCAPRLRLVIELDGSQHLAQQRYDEQRTQYLESRGYRVVRFWNDAVTRDLDTVLKIILEAAEKDLDSENTPYQPPPKS